MQYVECIDLGGVDTPTITATVETREGEFSLIAVHPVPPMRSGSARLRNAQLAEIATIVNRQPHPGVVVGDLNASCWSPQFRDLLRNAKLREARHGRGLYPTWPMHFPTSLLRIPIDHCLVSEGISIRDFRTGADVGSDHAPIVVDVSLEAARD